jgi:hypothetical protein
MANVKLEASYLCCKMDFFIITVYEIVRENEVGIIALSSIQSITRPHLPPHIVCSLCWQV